MAHVRTHHLPTHALQQCGAIPQTTILKKILRMDISLYIKTKPSAHYNKKDGVKTETISL